MPSKSKQCDRQLKAQEVLLTWARASACRDRAIEYSKPAHLTPDRNVRNRFIAIAHHYRTLAEIERRAVDKTASHSRQSQSTINRSHSGPFRSFAFVFLIAISSATTIIPVDLARAGDCLAAPNSPAPKGSHWRYHLNRATQQKCWYVRSPEKLAEHATAQTTSVDDAVPPTTQTGLTTAQDLDGPSPQVRQSITAIQDLASNTIPSKPAFPMALRENAELFVSQERALSDANVGAIAPTPVVWPDPPQTSPAIEAQGANTMAADASVDPVSRNADKATPSDDRASKFEIPIIIFPALALGLVVVGFGTRVLMKDASGRRAQTVDGSEPGTVADQSKDERYSDPRVDGAILEEGDFQSFARAMNGLGSSEDLVAPVQSTNEISTREARLAQLREDIARKLRWQQPPQARQQTQPEPSSLMSLSQILS